MIPIMIGVSLFLGGLGLAGVIWGIQRKQFDDPEKSVNLALYDDDLDQPPSSSSD